jgi:hypothetical protein
MNHENGQLTPFWPTGMFSIHEVAIRVRRNPPGFRTTDVCLPVGLGRLNSTISTLYHAYGFDATRETFTVPWRYRLRESAWVFPILRLAPKRHGRHLDRPRRAQDDYALEDERRRRGETDATSIMRLPRPWAPYSSLADRRCICWTLDLLLLCPPSARTFAVRRRRWTGQRDERRSDESA